MKLGTMSLWQGIMHVMDMVLTGKELFLELAVHKSGQNSWKLLILSGIVTKIYNINFLK